MDGIGWMDGWLLEVVGRLRAPLAPIKDQARPENNDGSDVAEQAETSHQRYGKSLKDSGLSSYVASNSSEQPNSTTNEYNNNERVTGSNSCFASMDSQLYL